MKIIILLIMLAASNLSHAEVSTFKAAGICYGLVLIGVQRGINFDELPKQSQDNIKKYYPYSLKMQECVKSANGNDDAGRQCIANLNDKNALEYWDGFIAGIQTGKKYGAELKIHTSTICSTLK